MGIFPTAGTDRYEIGSPLWDRVAIKLHAKEKPLLIITENGGTDRPYVQQIWLDERRIDRLWMHHGEIANGGTLKFEMGEKPTEEPSK